jgi:putative ABC transport system permease protein
MDGVLRVEPFRSLPARLRHEYRSRRTGVLGLVAGSDLRRLVERTGRTVPVPPEGVVLTAKLGELLGLRVGDTLTVEMLEGARRTGTVPVSGFVDELLGLSAYMDARALARLAGEGPTWSGAFLLVDPLGAARLYAQLKRTPGVAGVGSRDAALASFEATLQQSIGLMTSILVGCAVAIAFAMVYNSARIALSERGRELASLRVLGFTRGETAGLLLGEQALLTLVAVPLGLALGYGFCATLVANYQWEFFRLPLVLTRETYAFATGVVLVAATLSALAVRRRLNRLDLVAVLKTRE